MDIEVAFDGGVIRLKGVRWKGPVRTRILKACGRGQLVAGDKIVPRRATLADLPKKLRLLSPAECWPSTGLGAPSQEPSEPPAEPPDAPPCWPVRDVELEPHAVEAADISEAEARRRVDKNPFDEAAGAALLGALAAQGRWAEAIEEILVHGLRGPQETLILRRTGHVACAARLGDPHALREKDALDRARAHLSAGRVREARDEYETADPSDPRPRAWLQRCDAVLAGIFKSVSLDWPDADDLSSVAKQLHALDVRGDATLRAALTARKAYLVSRRAQLWAAERHRHRLELNSSYNERSFVSAPQTKTAYDVLGVDRTATSTDIKRAFRKKARETHPDKNLSEDASRFLAVQDAVDALNDPIRRAEIDASISDNTAAWLVRPTSVLYS